MMASIKVSYIGGNTSPTHLARFCDNVVRDHDCGDLTCGPRCLVFELLYRVIHKYQQLCNTLSPFIITEYF